MTDLQKSYREVIVAINSPHKGKKPTFGQAVKDETSRLGNAGVAVAITVMHTGEVKLQRLSKEIPDFTQSEIRISLSRLKKNGFFPYSRKEKRYQLSLDEGVDIGDGIYWALLGAVANGFIERSSK